jgi:hypothetical protein
LDQYSSSEWIFQSIDNVYATPISLSVVCHKAVEVGVWYTVLLHHFVETFLYDYMPFFIFALHVTNCNCQHFPRESNKYDKQLWFTI